MVSPYSLAGRSPAPGNAAVDDGKVGADDVAGKTVKPGVGVLRRVSNCAKSQAVAGIISGSHRSPSRAIALSITSSFRMAATSATFFGLPLATRRR